MTKPRTLPILMAALMVCCVSAVSCSGDDTSRIDLQLSAYKLDFTSEGGMQSVTVYATSAKPVKAETADDWITTLPHGELVDIRVAATDSVRNGEVRITVADVGTKIVRIVQDGPAITLSPEDYEFPAEGGDKEFTVASRYEGWEVEVVGEGFSRKAGPDEGTVIVTAAPNTGAARSGKLIIVGRDGRTAEATLRQQAYELEYRTLDRMDCLYIGDSGLGSTLFQVEAPIGSSDSVLVLWVCVTLSDTKGSGFDEGDYSVQNTGAVKTVCPYTQDASYAYPSYIITARGKLLYRIVDGGMNVRKEGKVYTFTMTFRASNAGTGEETELGFEYTGEIVRYDARGVYGFPYRDRLPSGTLERTDIKPGSYDASGTPGYIDRPCPGQWESQITAYNDWDWWVEGWGETLEHCGLIILDYYPEKKNIAIRNYGEYGVGPLPDGTVIYFRAESFYMRDNELYSIEVASPRWDSNTLDFSAIKGPGGETSWTGVTAYNLQTDEFVGYCTDLYRDAKLDCRVAFTQAPRVSGEPFGSRFNGLTGLYELPEGISYRNPLPVKKPLAGGGIRIEK